MDEIPTAPPENALLKALKAHRLYGAAVGYLVAAWIVLQVAAIVLPGFGAPTWVLRALMIVLALGLGVTLLNVWGSDRRRRGLPLMPRAVGGKLAWVLTAILPAALVALFFVLHPLGHPAPAAPPVDKSVAVLPFANLSADKDNAFFADGVQDEVLTDLSKVEDLKVISRTSVAQYRDANRNLSEIARALGVAYVVEGSVQRAGGKIRVTAQLIEARTDTHRWAEHYDRDLQDVFAIQSDIAQAIAGKLQAAISPQTHAAMTEAPTRDLQAYDLYLHALETFRSGPGGNPRVWLDRIVDLLTEATRQDPGFARAYTFLAEVQGLIYAQLEPTSARAAVVRSLVETASRLRPGSADAYEAMGTYAFLIEHDYRRAHDELAQAVRLAPSDSKSLTLLAATERFLGSWDDALAHYRKAAELDPEDKLWSFDYVQTLEALRRYPEAVAALDALVPNHPRDSALLSGVQIEKARILLGWKADVRGALALLAALPAPAGTSERVARARIFCDYCARDYAAADRDLAAWPSPTLAGDPRAMWEGYTAHYRGDGPAAEKAFLVARPLLAAMVDAAPANDRSLLSLGTADVALGHKAEGLAEVRRAAAVHSLDRDAWLGPESAGDLAVALAWAGEREEAIGLVQTLCAHPNGPSYGYLKLHPDWDSLRGDGRFEAAVASLAPQP